jgi:hypothetical protein
MKRRLSAKSKRWTVGGYMSGDTLVSQLKPR